MGGDRDRDGSQAARGDIGRAVHRVVIGLIAGVWPGRKPQDVSRWLAAMPPRKAQGIEAATLLALFLVALVFAQFGLLGLAVFLALVIFLVG